MNLSSTESWLNHILLWLFSTVNAKSASKKVMIKGQSNIWPVNSSFGKMKGVIWKWFGNSSSFLWGDEFESWHHPAHSTYYHYVGGTLNYRAHPPGILCKLPKDLIKASSCWYCSSFPLLLRRSVEPTWSECCEQNRVKIWQLVNFCWKNECVRVQSH